MPPASEPNLPGAGPNNEGSGWDSDAETELLDDKEEKWPEQADYEGNPRPRLDRQLGIHELNSLFGIILGPAYVNPQESNDEKEEVEEFPRRIRPRPESG